MECQQYFWKTNEINWVNQSQKVLPLSCSKLPAPGCIRYKFYKKLWKYRNPQASHCPLREKWSKIEKLSVNINGFLPREPSDYVRGNAGFQQHWSFKASRPHPCTLRAKRSVFLCQSEGNDCWRRVSTYQSFKKPKSPAYHGDTSFDINPNIPFTEKEP